MAVSPVNSNSKTVLERMDIEEVSHFYTIDDTFACACIDCARCPYYNLTPSRAHILVQIHHLYIHIVNQSTHSKCFGGFANHSPFFRRRGSASPLIVQRTTGTYPLSFPSALRAKIRALTDL
jgi:hypothetical protein